jgi:hypothetical protein
MKAEAAMMISIVLIVSIIFYKVVLPILLVFLGMTIAWFLLKEVLIPGIIFLFSSILWPVGLFLIKATVVIIILYLLFLFVGRIYLKYSSNPRK